MYGRWPHCSRICRHAKRERSFGWECRAARSNPALEPSPPALEPSPPALEPSPPAPLPQGGEGRRMCAWEFESRSVWSRLLCVLCARFLPFPHDSSLGTQHSEKPSPPAPLPQGEGRRTCVVVGGARRRNSPASPFVFFVFSVFSVFSVVQSVCPYSRLITWHSALEEALTPGPSP